MYIVLHLFENVNMLDSERAATVTVLEKHIYLPPTPNYRDNTKSQD